MELPPSRKTTGETKTAKVQHNVDRSLHARSAPGQPRSPSELPTTSFVASGSSASSGRYIGLLLLHRTHFLYCEHPPDPWEPPSFLFWFSETLAFKIKISKGVLQKSQKGVLQKCLFARNKLPEPVPEASSQKSYLLILPLYTSDNLQSFPHPTKV